MYDFEQYALYVTRFFTCFLKNRMIENKKNPQFLFVENKKNTLRMVAWKCFGAENRGRTDTMFPSRDFKSLASAYSATSANEKDALDVFFGGTTQIWTGDEGFADLCLTTWL